MCLRWHRVSPLSKSNAFHSLSLFLTFYSRTTAAPLHQSSALTKTTDKRATSPPVSLLTNQKAHHRECFWHDWDLKEVKSRSPNFQFSTAKPLAFSLDKLMHPLYVSGCLICRCLLLCLLYRCQILTTWLSCSKMIYHNIYWKCFKKID